MSRYYDFNEQKLLHHLEGDAQSHRQEVRSRAQSRLVGAVLVSAEFVTDMLTLHFRTDEGDEFVISVNSERLVPTGPYAPSQEVSIEEEIASSVLFMLDENIFPMTAQELDGTVI
jgi:hypothetical protein